MWMFLFQFLLGSFCAYALNDFEPYSEQRMMIVIVTAGFITLFIKMDNKQKDKD